MNDMKNKLGCSKLAAFFILTIGVALCLIALPVIDHAQSPARGSSASASLPLDQPQLLPGPRPSAATIQQWKDRKFGMFIHFGLYSEFGGMYQGKKIDNCTSPASRRGCNTHAF
jgi:hypothetical protein